VSGCACMCSFKDSMMERVQAKLLRVSITPSHLTSTDTHEMLHNIFVGLARTIYIRCI